MKHLLTLGEPLAVLGSEDKNASLSEIKHFTKYLAGAELNVAVGVARLGLKAKYVSSVGTDPFGISILKDIKNNNVSTEYIDEDNEHWTGFYLKQQVDEGDPEVFYYRKNSAAAHFDINKLANIDFSNVGLVHTSGIMAGISQEGFKSTERLLELANKQKILTTFDTNIRKPLWKDEDTMIEGLNYLAKKAQIILPGINEGQILIGTKDPEKIADFYLNQSEITNTVIVKLGAKGAYVKNKSGLSLIVDGFKAEKIVDTVGAGDGFAVGVISGLLKELSIEEAIVRACAIGALAVQSKGDSDGYPTEKQLQSFIEENTK